MSKTITKAEFNDLVINGDGYVFVDFYAEWCGPCKLLGPIIDDINKTNEVYKINVDDNRDLARKYGIMSIPCIILFKNGEEVNRCFGLKTKNEILELLK